MTPPMLKRVPAIRCCCSPQQVRPRLRSLRSCCEARTRRGVSSKGFLYTGSARWPRTCRLCWLCCRKPTCICRMSSKLPFTRRSPVSGLAKADVGNAWSRHRAITARSTALAWWIGAMAGSMAELRLDEQLLLADVETHFQALAQTPAEVLRHIGSPFAPDKDQNAPLPLAQAA